MLPPLAHEVRSCLAYGELSEVGRDGIRHLAGAIQLLWCYRDQASARQATADRLGEAVEPVTQTTWCSVQNGARAGAKIAPDLISEKAKQAVREVLLSKT
jgi:hypothetical protein